MTSTGVDPNLFPLRAKGARAPLFLVAAPGINALGYAAVVRLLPQDRPVYVVQPRRRGCTFPSEGIGPDGRNEYPIVAAEYARSIRSVQPEGPYCLAGMCDGAHLAFQMARLLEAAGERVSRLLVLDTWPLENTTSYPLLMLSIRWRRFREKSPAERWAVLRRGMSRAFARGAALLGIARADPLESGKVPTRDGERRTRWRALLWPGRGFRPPMIDASITVFRVREQPLWRIRDQALGWRGRTRGTVSVHLIPGDHEDFFRAPHVATFARTLSACLEEKTP